MLPITVDVWHYLSIVGLVSASGFLSSSETSFFSLSKFQMRLIRERYRAAFDKLTRIHQDPAGVLLTLLISNELINVTLSALITSWMYAEFQDPEHATLYTLCVATPIIVIACELTPKVLGTSLNTLLAPILVSFFKPLYRFMLPLRWIARSIEKIFRNDNPHNQQKKRMREEDFLRLAEEATQNGNLKPAEFELIRRIFKMDDTPIITILKKMSDTFTLPHNITGKTALQRIEENLSPTGSHYSRIPVYQYGTSEIIGILYTKDLLTEKLNDVLLLQPVTQWVRKPLVLHESVRINNAFFRMRREQTHLAIVQNLDEEILGILTMTDLLRTVLP